ncbi:hypothetical protein S40293_10538 [Stachybotrys chartarum IBT 40293]|nr:hypothetical protein S40293_10538 [Stachybotrys chartarum IBT 40293]
MDHGRPGPGDERPTKRPRTTPIRPDFLDLPLENVVEALCLECPRPPWRSRRHELSDGSRLNSHPPMEARHCYSPTCWCSPILVDLEITQTLASLAGTCRTLYAIATPHVYHRPATRKWWLLANTLISRPDLAAHVRVLSNHLWKAGIRTSTEVAPRAVDDYYMAMKFAYARYRDAEFNDAEATAIFEDHNTSINIMTNLCPSVEEMDLVHRGGPFLFACEETPLRRMRNLVLGRSSQDADTVDSETISTLGKKTPQLANLVLRGICARSFAYEYPLPSLIRLRLEDSCIEVEALRALLGSCSSITEFQFRASFEELGLIRGFDPKDLQMALRLCVPNLESLSIDMSSDLTRCEAPVPVERLIQTLDFNVRLRDLTIETGCFLGPKYIYLQARRYRRGCGGQRLEIPSTKSYPDVPREVIMDLLPVSIVRLRITTATDGPRPNFLARGLEEMARQVNDSFPKLEVVIVEEMYQSRVWALADAFKAAGVRFSTG